MATDQVPEIALSDDRVSVTDLEITDPFVVEYFEKFDDGEEQKNAFKRVLKIGVMTIGLAETSQQEEFVERKFTEMQHELQEEIDRIEEEVEEKFGDDGDVPKIFDDHLGEDGHLKKHIEEAFSEDGPFKQRLDEELGENGERIQAALDPDNEGSPTYRLEKRLKSEINSIREKIVEEETEADIRKQTYLKGGDFEDSIQEILNGIVRQTPNNVEYTGDTTGEMERKVGDFVVTLADTGQRIVVEAKTESYSTKNIKNEMAEAIQNRDAQYGLFVTDTLENLPRTKTGWFHEFPDQNIVVVAMRETTDEDLEPGYLRIAFNWARMRAVQAYAETGSGFDPEKLQSEITEIEESIGQFKTIRGQCTEIRKSRERIEEMLDEVERDIKNRIGSIEAELIKAEE